MTTPPALAPGYVANFDTLRQAARLGDLGLVSAIRAKDQQPVALICAMHTDEEGSISITPLAEMCSGNPYEDYEDPTL